MIELSKREKWLMQQAMGAAEYYKDLSQWIDESIDDAGHTVEQLFSFDAPSDWEPIETAPKDGTYFLGYEEDYGVHKCRWDKNHDGGVGGFRNTRHGWSPTHWQPLPPILDSNKR